MCAETYYFRCYSWCTVFFARKHLVKKLQNSLQENNSLCTSIIICAKKRAQSAPPLLLLSTSEINCQLVVKLHNNGYIKLSCRTNVVTVRV